MNRPVKILLIILITAAVMCNPHTAAVLADSEEIRYYSKNEIMEFAQGIIEWKTNSADALSAEELISDKLSVYAGDQAADWYIFGMARLDIPYDFSKYLRSLGISITEIYNSTQVNTLPVTEFHRMALTISAAGGDPSMAAPKIDLIADSTYNRDADLPLDKQGITGLIWALITLDSMQYDVPEGSINTREGIIEEILANEIEGGGFALSGSAADPDITAMAVQALSPYYNSTGPNADVKDVIDRALGLLSGLQEENGDFSSWGNKNAQTGAQVMVALCCLGIDPQRDTRFIKNKNTLMDGLLRYRMEDKGFANTYPAERSNSKTSEQVLYAFASVLRQMSGERNLYDMRPEMSEDIRQKIDSLVEDIDNINSEPEIQALKERYLEIPEDERMYVYNYHKLKDIPEYIGASYVSDKAQDPENEKDTNAGMLFILLAAALVLIISIPVLILAIRKKRRND